jgi:hypothetical protein
VSTLANGISIIPGDKNETLDRLTASDRPLTYESTMKRSVLAVCLFTGSFLIACDDGKTPTSSDSDRKSLLVASQWKLTAHTVTPELDYEGDGHLIADLYEVSGACIHDDIHTFKADSKWSVDEGASKCDPEDPQIEQGSWSMNATQTELTLQSELDQSPTVFKIASASSSQLKVTLTSTDWTDEVEHTETLTFTTR